MEENSKYRNMSMGELLSEILGDDTIKKRDVNINLYSGNITSETFIKKGFTKKQTAKILASVELGKRSMVDMEKY
jgi:hypothetical protein